jgi:uncharacterized protein YbjQ (UPF0145 family)
MRLTNSSSIFPIRLQHLTGSVYVANVTARTTGELLLDNFQEFIGDNLGTYYKLVYNDKDIRFKDTLEGLRIKVV